jgi:hypothetical protein
MAQPFQQNGEYFKDPNDIHSRREKDEISYEGKSSTAAAPAYSDGYEAQTGEVYDPYGGKKLGMIRVGSFRSLQYDEEAKALL